VPRVPVDVRWTTRNWFGVSNAVSNSKSSHLVLMKWFSGWMSAPHTYVTDRLCVVIYPGGFVRRVAGTPHYHGALAGAPEPAVIAFGDRPAGDQEPLLRPPPERSVDLPLVRPAR
jgi:hypothetical protein